MSAGKTIIVPQGVINPNAMTVIEIPAESQHESVFVANVTQPQGPGMNCQYLFNQSNIEPPREFRPRYESSPLENRPQRDPTPVTMDSSIFNNQTQSQLSGSPCATMDYNKVWKPDYGTPSVDFTGSNLDDNMSLKMTSSTSIRSSDSAKGRAPTRTMVTTTKLINLTSADRSHDYYKPKQSPGFHPRHKGEVHTPESYNNMRYCDQQSTRVDGNKDMYFSGIEDSEAGSGGMRTSMFKQLMGGEMPRQMIQPMLSRVEKEGYPHNEYGMPIGPSPAKSYYKKARVGEHDQKIVSTITMDESSGMATANVTRSPGRSRTNPGQQNATVNRTHNACPGSANNTCSGGGSPRNNPGMAAANVTHSGGRPVSGAGSPNYAGEICSGSVCAGGTFCKSAAILGLSSPGGSPSRPRSPANTTSHGITTPKTHGRIPVGNIAYMQAVPPSAAGGAANVTCGQRRPALNTTVGQPAAGMNATFARPALNATVNMAPAGMNATFARPALNATVNMAPAGMNATFARPALNATVNMPPAGMNATFDQAFVTPRGYARPRPEINPNFGVAAGYAGGTSARSASPPALYQVASPMEFPNALRTAEREERRMIGEDLTRLQKERRRLFTEAGYDRRAELKADLFGDAYVEDDSPCKSRSKSQMRKMPSSAKPPWRY